MIPIIAAIGRTPDAARHSAHIPCIGMSDPFPHSRIDYSGIGRIDHYIDCRRGIGQVKHPLPIDAAVGRSIDSSFRIRPPQSAGSRRENFIRIVGIDGYPSDVRRFLQSPQFPGLPAVSRTPDAVAGIGIGGYISFAGAHPNNIGIVRIDCDCANRQSSRFIEHRSPGYPSVHRFQHSSSRRADIYHGRIGRMHTHVGYPAADIGRTGFRPEKIVSSLKIRPQLFSLFQSFPVSRNIDIRLRISALENEIIRGSAFLRRPPFPPFGDFIGSRIEQDEAYNKSNKCQ